MLLPATFDTEAVGPRDLTPLSANTMGQFRDNDVAKVNDRNVSLSGFGKESNALF